MPLDELLFAEKQARFARLCREMLLQKHTSGEAGIGTLAEKRLHVIIKRYLCENEDFHEVGVPNTRYVSDVRIENEIFEVQTGAFYPMQKKILHYLAHTDCTITVVHPIAVKKWVSWMDPKTGELTDRKRSPQRGRPEDLLAELYGLLPALGNPRLRFRILLIEAEDFRLLSGRKKNRKLGAKKYERIPLALLDDLTLSRPCDFVFMIPEALPDHFTVKQFSDLAKIRGRDAYSAVRALCALGLFAPADPIGRSMGWKKLSIS
ncbi:MAG: hypothetical protein IJW16_02910 [Clostridia bacterium]|nr:hypothetical protein [Clostridia bacterium]